MRILRIWLCALCALLCTGCVSLQATFDHKSKEIEPVDMTRKVYIGTRLDAWVVTSPFSKQFWTEETGGGDVFWFFFLFSIVDLPLSMVMDTVLLPYTIPHDSRPKNKGRG